MTLAEPTPVVLDTCVLVDACLRDTLLRLAETPRLYSPRWSSRIMDELGRTLRDKLGRTAVQWSYLYGKLAEHFPEAWVEGFDAIIPSLTNHEKDRHVLAAAIQARAGLIVTYNSKDFRAADPAPWRVAAISPDAFLGDCLDENPSLVIAKLDLQAADCGRSTAELLDRLRLARVTGFVEKVMAESGSMHGRSIGAGQGWAS